jgi:predicted metal-binding protein
LDAKINTMSGKISCKRAVNFISKKEEGKLSSGQRFALWRHLGECSLCRIFSVQNKIIGQAMMQQQTRELTIPEKEVMVKAVLQTEQ